MHCVACQRLLSEVRSAYAELVAAQKELLARNSFGGEVSTCWRWRGDAYERWCRAMDEALSHLRRHVSSTRQEQFGCRRTYIMRITSSKCRPRNRAERLWVTVSPYQIGPGVFAKIPQKGPLVRRYLNTLIRGVAGNSIVDQRGG